MILQQCLHRMKPFHIQCITLCLHKGLHLDKPLAKTLHLQFISYESVEITNFHWFGQGPTFGVHTPVCLPNACIKAKWASLCCKNMAWSVTNFVTSLAGGRFIVPSEVLILVCPWVDSTWVYLWPSKWLPFCDAKVSFEGTNLSLDGFPPFPCLPKEFQGISKFFLLEDGNFEGLSSPSTNYFPLSFFP